MLNSTLQVLPDKQILAFVAHLPLQATGGGVYAVSWHVHQELQKRFLLTPFVQVVPATGFGEIAVSKIRRKVLRVPGKFYQFSPRTLERTAALVETYVRGADAVFFRSSTRWIKCRPKVPYFIHTDAIFHTFFNNTFDPANFILSDLQRIWNAERDFLENAACVFFESEWGLRKAREAYGLQGDHYVVINNGGGLEPPSEDIWDGNYLRLLTIAKDFRQKGGDLVFEAFKQLKRSFPELKWSIIGGPPDPQTLNCAGVTYEGFLRPESDTELTRFRALLADAFLLIHPTREDVNPLVLIEAAYFGCPSISVDDFAIPELVINGETGVLLQRPLSIPDLVSSVAQLVVNRESYLKLRQNARSRSLSKFTWDEAGGQMHTEIRRRLSLLG